MTNPWLKIPAKDYEGHMLHPQVGQFPFLAETFFNALKSHNPERVAFLGCATGNGLEFVRDTACKRLTVIDFNPEFLDVLENRYEKLLPKPDIRLDNLEHCKFPEQEYTLIMAGLIFEFIENIQDLLCRISKSLIREGTLVTVLQLPGTNISSITKTPYASIKDLHTIMNLVERNDFCEMAGIAELKIHTEETITLTTGKSFYIGTYKKDLK
ncbi:MAG: class I SAM-dependent methyltransferase [Fibrobacteria bacterium]|nr:class I SAM-dependent methyltransferase [Fibrobacteria bacterium]